MNIRPFDPTLQDSILDLIVGIQQSEYGLDIDADQQPDLTQISSF